jgi:hypothetical protein
MNNYGILYALGCIFLLLGERMLGDSQILRYILSISGTLALLSSLYISMQTHKNANEGQRKALSYPQTLIGCTLVALLMYALTTDTMLNILSLQEETEAFLIIIIRVLSALLFTCSAIPLMAITYLHNQGPYHISNRNARPVLLKWLGFSFLLCSLFPINYIAQEKNTRWDLGYFKTTMPGSSTISLAENLSEPIQVYLFFPNTSKIRQEIRTFFDLIPQNRMTINYLDHALEPDLAKKLKVRDNGYVVFVRGEGEEEQIERIKIGTDFDSARRKLKRLDGEVREALLKLSKGPKNIYVTTGHGEFHWKSSDERDVSQQISSFKKILRSFNLSVKELNIANGLGNKIPEDAAMVLVLGPENDFLEEEIQSLIDYHNSGGNLFVSLEPVGSTMTGLLTHLELTYRSDLYLANDTIFVPRSNKNSDRRNLATNKYSTHPSVTTLSRNSKELVVIFPDSGVLEKKKGSKAKATIRSMENTFADENSNFKKDPIESAKIWSLAIAIENEIQQNTTEDTTETKEQKSRSLVFADSSWLSDMIILQNRGNAQAAIDAITWLMDIPEASGDINDENDVKVEHSKSGQGWIFYGSSLLFPISIVLLGAFRVRSRRKE